MTHFTTAAVWLTNNGKTFSQLLCVASSQSRFLLSQPTDILCCFCCRYRTNWRTLNFTSIRPRISRSSNTWRWALSWPLLQVRATLCSIPMPPASRWPPCRSWGTDTCPPLTTAATQTALLPCSRCPITTARWVDLIENETVFQVEDDVAEYMELKLWLEMRGDIRGIVQRPRHFQHS